MLNTSLSKNEVFLFIVSGITSEEINSVIVMSCTLKACSKQSTIALISFKPTVSFTEIEIVSLSI